MTLYNRMMADPEMRPLIEAELALIEEEIRLSSSVVEHLLGKEKAVGPIPT